MTQPQSQDCSTTQKPKSSKKANPTLLIPQLSCYLGHIQYIFLVPVLQPSFPSWISPQCNPSALTFGTGFFWLFLNHSLVFFFFFCKLFWFALHGPLDLPLDPFHAPLIQSSSPTPTCPPVLNLLLPSPTDLSKRTWATERNCILGKLIWPPGVGQAGGSRLAGSLLQNVRIWTGNGKWMKMKWKTQALVFVLGCQGNHLISLKSWFEGVSRKKLSKVEAAGIGLLLTNFGEKITVRWKNWVKVES